MASPLPPPPAGGPPPMAMPPAGMAPPQAPAGPPPPPKGVRLATPAATREKLMWELQQAAYKDVPSTAKSSPDVPWSAGGRKNRNS